MIEINNQKGFRVGKFVEYNCWISFQFVKNRDKIQEEIL